MKILILCKWLQWQRSGNWDFFSFIVNLFISIFVITNINYFRSLDLVVSVETTRIAIWMLQHGQKCIASEDGCYVQENFIYEHWSRISHNFLMSWNILLTYFQWLKFIQVLLSWWAIQKHIVSRPIGQITDPDIGHLSQTCFHAWCDMQYEDWCSCMVHSLL